MFQRILVALDGSSRAEQAIPMAIQLARSFDGTILLVEVVRGPAEFEVGAVSPAIWAPPANPLDRERARDYLKRVAAGDQFSGIVTETGVYAGPAAGTLRLIAQVRKADLVVMATRGLTGLKRWALGSVAEQVIHESDLPVLLLPQHDDPTLSSAVAERPCALVALDGSAFSEAAIVPAAHLVRALSGSDSGALHLLRVLDEVDTETLGENELTPFAAHAATQEWALQQASEYLTTTAARVREALGRTAPTITWSVAVNPQFGSYVSDVAGVILRTAEAGEPVAGVTAPTRCSVIAMASHGRGGLSHWILGSITLRVLHTTNLPMLIVRPPAAPRRSTAD